MPISLNTNEEGSFLSPGYKKLPRSVEPLAAEDELGLLLDLIHEVNEKFFVDLDDDVELQDKLLAEVETEVSEARRFVVIGNSHASRLVCAMEDLGLEAKLISAAGWADDPELNNSIAMMIKEEVELGGENVVLIYFLYDNEIYMVEHDGGELTAPVRMAGSSKYHINGKLAVVGRDKFRDIFNVSVPLLRAGRDNPKLIVSPLLRYITAPCCKGSGHLLNYGGPEYALYMGEAVENIRQWLKDFTFGKKIRNFKVICSNTIIGVEDEDEAEKRRKVKEYWSSDPVHLSSAGYEKIAEDLSKKAESGLTRPVEKKREGGVMMGPSCKRARWIEEDDVTINRSGG
jgi:hypothetical protein